MTDAQFSYRYVNFAELYKLLQFNKKYTAIFFLHSAQASSIMNSIIFVPIAFIRSLFCVIRLLPAIKLSEMPLTYMRCMWIYYYVKSAR